MISFGLDEDEELILETAKKFAQESLWPKIRETESARALPLDVAREAHALGLRALGIPEASGGQGLGLGLECIVEEQIAYGDAGACYGLAGPGALLCFVRELGTEEQQREILSRYTASSGSARRGAVAWSECKPADREGLRTTAERSANAWLIRGDKAFVVNGGVASEYVVLAQVDPSKGYAGLGAFVVPADAEGVQPGPRRIPLGLDAAVIADVRFEGVAVGDGCRLTGGNDFSASLGRAFARHALLVASRCVGVASRTWELTQHYCEERKAFGKPIGHFQAVAFTVADRLMDVESGRWMIWRAAAHWDKHGTPDLALIAAASAHAQEAAMRCGDDGVQLFGGAGFVRDFPVEKCFRDARQLGLMGPTVATLDQLHAEIELGVLADPATFLPTSDIQPIIL